MTINSKTKVYVEVADTDAKRIHGLSGREGLKDNEGMLFVFENEGLYSFWMKEMKFDLDFVWIRNNKIVDIIQNVSHNNQEVIYRPKTPVTEVLEINAGFVEKNGIKIGDAVNIN